MGVFHVFLNEKVCQNETTAPASGENPPGVTRLSHWQGMRVDAKSTGELEAPVDL